MKLLYKIAIFNAGAALLAGLLVGWSNGVSFFDFLAIIGTFTLLTSLLDLVIALVLAIAGRRAWAQAFLLSAGILLLVGGAVCSSLILG